MEPIAPDQWAADAGRPLFGEPPFGTGSGNRWNKYAHVALVLLQRQAWSKSVRAP